MAELNTEGWMWTPSLMLEDNRKWSPAKMRWYRRAFTEWKKEFPAEAKAKLIEQTEMRLQRLKSK